MLRTSDFDFGTQTVVSFGVQIRLFHHFEGSHCQPDCLNCSLAYTEKGGDADSARVGSVERLVLAKNASSLSHS